jgi:MoaA/NifB/PqqE/SkfB family radical SAM enzyme
MQASTIFRGALARFGVRAYPLSLSFELTWLCNLACDYCDRHTPMPREMTLEQILKALGEFRELGMAETNLDGGEALAHRHVGEIVDWLVERGVEVNLNSNGILIPSRIETVRKVRGVKISLDGPPEAHDLMRGKGSFQKAVHGAKAAREAGCKVEFGCTVGSHNAQRMDELVAIAEELGIGVVFQPVLNSLFNDTVRDGSRWLLRVDEIRAAFRRIEELKRKSKAVANDWSSLVHFRSFPAEKRPPCAAGWVMATMDPEGCLFACGQLNRSDRSNNVVALGARAAFERLEKKGCGQCWCARLVESNYVWGLQLHKSWAPAPQRELAAATT